MADSKADIRGFFYCGHGRCPVRFWPVAEGDKCPVCGQGGGFAGFVAKHPTFDPHAATEEDDA